MELKKLIVSSFGKENSKKDISTSKIRGNCQMEIKKKQRI